MKTKLLLGLALILGGYGRASETSSVPVNSAASDAKAFIHPFSFQIEDADTHEPVPFVTVYWTERWQEASGSKPFREQSGFLFSGNTNVLCVSNLNEKVDNRFRFASTDYEPLTLEYNGKAAQPSVGFYNTRQSPRPLATYAATNGIITIPLHKISHHVDATNLDALAAYKTIIPETIPHDACSTNMTQLGAWLRIAIGEGDRFPSSLAALAVCTNYPNFSNTLLVCPATGHVPGAISNVEAWTDYIYVGNGLEGGMCDVALLISPPENHGGKFGYVLWGCGNVTQLDASYVRALIKAPWCLPARARGETFVRDDGFDKFVKPTIKVRIPARFSGIYAGTTNSVEGTNSEEKIPAGYGNVMDVQQVLHIYAELTGADLKLQDGISTNRVFIKLGSYPAMTRAETVAYLEKELREQAGIIAVHKDTGHVEFEQMKNPEQKR